MNKSQFLEKLKSLISVKNQITDSEQNIQDITINLQQAKAGDIVFYKLNPATGLADFEKRMKSSDASLVVLNFGVEKTVKYDNCIFIEEDKFLQAQKIILDELYPNQNKMKLVGITGTNGKTTSVNLSMQISTMLGHKAISVGTIGVFDANGEVYPEFGTTTPSYVDLRKIINKFQNDYEACFMEVSSHSLVQNRLNELRLDAGAWTSFSQDHLDYHQTMEDYFKAKMLLEKVYLKENASVVVPKFEVKMIEQILSANPNAKIKVAKTLGVRKLENLPLFYRSKYNQSNLEISLEVNEILWGQSQAINVEKIQTPKGRFSIIELGDESMAIVDYAHTPDALTNIGNAIKEAFPTHKVTVIFGCGGNRDKTKRPKMAKAVSAFADKMIITSDNPRNEAPEDIILDIIKNATFGYEAIVDRKKAIICALEECEENEIILIAGKGHEEYQEVNGVKHDFSDFKVVEDYIEENS